MIICTRSKVVPVFLNYMRYVRNFHLRENKCKHRWIVIKMWLWISSVAYQTWEHLPGCSYSAWDWLNFRNVFWLIWEQKLKIPLILNLGAVQRHLLTTSFPINFRVVMSYINLWHQQENWVIFRCKFDKCLTLEKRKQVLEQGHWESGWTWHRWGTTLFRNSGTSLRSSPILFCL